MSKYQWYDTKLKKRSQICDVLTLILALVLLYMYFTGDCSRCMTYPLIGAVGLFIVSWMAKRKDTKLKRLQIKPPKQ